MEALQCYGSDSDSSDEEVVHAETLKKARLTKLLDEQASDGVLTETTNGLAVAASRSSSFETVQLPPPPPNLLNASNSSRALQFSEAHSGRVRSFPHVEGNFALHVYIPVPLSSAAERQLEPMMKRAFTFASELRPMEIDSLSEHATREPKLAKQYHMSLSRTVPIRVQQINSIVSMLRHKFECQKGFWLGLDHWDVFVNDEQTRSFLSLEVANQGLSEICGQICKVNEVFKLHNLPAYYETPRPHVSMAWALGNATPPLRRCVEELKGSHESALRLPLWSHHLNRIECKIGSQTYCIWKQNSPPRAPL